MDSAPASPSSVSGPSQPRAPARPLVSATLAVALGTGLGLASAETAPGAALGPAAALWTGFNPRPGASSASAAGPPPLRGTAGRHRPAPLARRGLAGRRRRTPGAGRGLARGGPRRRAPRTRLARSLVDPGRGPRPPRQHARPRFGGSRCAGRVAGLAFEAEGLAAREGEWVRVLSGEAPVPPPRWEPVDRGREPPGDARGDAREGERLEVRPDQVVRLAPPPGGSPSTGAGSPLARWRARSVVRLAALDSEAAAAWPRRCSSASARGSTPSGTSSRAPARATCSR